MVNVKDECYELIEEQVQRQVEWDVWEQMDEQLYLPVWEEMTRQVIDRAGVQVMRPMCEEIDSGG